MVFTNDECTSKSEKCERGCSLVEIVHFVEQKRLINKSLHLRVLFVFTVITSPENTSQCSSLKELTKQIDQVFFFKTLLSHSDVKLAFL